MDYVEASVVKEGAAGMAQHSIAPAARPMTSDVIARRLGRVDGAGLHKEERTRPMAIADPQDIAARRVGAWAGGVVNSNRQD